MSHPRKHGLDFLRALMMFLGVVLHAAASFMPGEPDASWPYRDPERSVLLGLAGLFIHMFRMPAFFALAGFFFAQSLERQPLREVMRDRSVRLIVPLIVGWFLLSPLVTGAFVFGRAQSEHRNAQDVLNLAGLLSSTTWSDPHPMHLWFLWYLWIAMFVISILNSAWTRWIPRRARDWGNRAVHSTLSSERPLAPSPLLTAATFIAVMNMKMPSIDTPGSFIPIPSIVLCYTFFFWVGARTYQLRDSLLTDSAIAMRFLARGMIFTIFFVIASIVWFDTIAKTGTGSLAAFLIAQASFALAIWPLLFGCATLAENLITRENAIIRYLSDSAYWVYLVHLPLCIGIAAALRNAPYSALVKCSITITITLVICFATYEAAKLVLSRHRKAMSAAD